MKPRLFMVFAALFFCCLGAPSLHAQTTTRVVVESEGWELVGDLVLPPGSAAVPAVLLLNQADGDRTPYEGLAGALAVRGIGSLRLDLRGHGESTNLGAFTPGEHRRDPLIWDAEVDVAAAHDFLRSHERVVPDLIGVVGASYSGEEAAEAAGPTDSQGPMSCFRRAR